MSSSLPNGQPELQAYALGEATEAERREAELYLASHPEAVLEVERLQLVAAALRRLPEEEPPRRIAFVSDKVFEPKWFKRWWNSAPKLGFASAAMLTMAIVAHGVMAQRTASSTQAPVAMAQGSQAELSRLVDAEVSRRLDPAIQQVRAEYQAKSQGMVNTALDQAERKFALERQQDRLAVEANFRLLRQTVTRALQVASYERPRVGNQ